MVWSDVAAGARYSSTSLLGDSGAYGSRAYRWGTGASGSSCSGKPVTRTGGTPRHDRWRSDDDGTNARSGSEVCYPEVMVGPIRGRHLLLDAARLTPLASEVIGDGTSLETTEDIRATIKRLIAGLDPIRTGSDVWCTIRMAAEECGDTYLVEMCRWREVEARCGYVGAHLSLLAATEGGRTKPVFTGYRSSWDVGNRLRGELVLNDGPLTLEECESVQPGGSARIRIHPLDIPSWRLVRSGQVIHLHEGSRRYGSATVTELCLMDEAAHSVRDYDP